MHYRMFVFTNHGKTADDARSYVYNELQNDDSFCGDGGLFGSSVTDWFVIGGRWSGELQLLTNPKLKNYFVDIQKTIKIKSGWGLSTKDVEENKETIQKVWRENGGELNSPYLRDTYERNGYSDDCAKTTTQLYKEIMNYEKLQFDGHIAKKGEWHVVAIDLEYDNLDIKNQVGKWVVVVDYHN